jgi:hypothetical protein
MAGDPMRAVSRLAVAVMLTFVSGRAVAQPALDLRLLEVETVPERPGFAETFEVRFGVRLPAGSVLILPDTLPAAEGVEGSGAVSWTVRPAPGDSTDVIVTYPAIAFLDGRVTLPEVPLGVGTGPAGGAGESVVRGSSPGAAGGRVGDGIGGTGGAARGAAGGGGTAVGAMSGGAVGSAAGGPAGGPAAGSSPGPAAGSDGGRAEGARADAWVARLGAVEVAAYAPFAEDGAVLVPRPPADVAGGEWGLWLVLAIGLASAAGVGGAGFLVPPWWRSRGAALFGRFLGRSPVAEALRELDWVRSTSWHRNGRVDDFYASATDTVRRYAERVDGECGGALTSTELLAVIEERWGRGMGDSIAPVVERAERVKFGMLRPEPDAAERDLAALRDWIRTGPGRP